MQQKSWNWGLALLLVACLFSIGCSVADRRARHAEKGEKYFAKERYPEAILEYMNALQGDPTNSPIVFKVGMSYLKLSDYQQAYRFLYAASELAPNDTEAKLQLGLLMLAGDETERAWELAQAILQLEPGKLEALLLLCDSARTPSQIQEARDRMQAEYEHHAASAGYHMASGALYARTGDLVRAETAYREAIVHDPKFAIAHLQLGTLHQSRGDSAAAEAEFKTASDLSPPNSIARVKWAVYLKTQGKRDEARQILKDVTDKHPDYTPALLATADMALSDQDLDGCTKLLDQVLKLQPDNLDARTLRGRVALARGDAQGAATEFQALVERRPKASALRFMLATAFVADHRADEAAVQLKEALELRPGYIDARLMLSELQLRSKEAAQVIAPLEALVKAVPGVGRAYVLLGSAYRMLGQLDKAEQTFQRLADVTPKSPDGPYLRGLVLREQDKTEAAEASFEKTLEITPEYGLAAAQLVAMAIQRGDNAGAVTRLEAQVAKVPDSPSLVFLLGNLYLQQGDTNRAEQAYEKSIALKPDFAGGYMQLCQLYVKNGRSQEALEKAKEAVQNNPKNVSALMLAATLSEQSKDYAQARALYERILQVAPRFGAAANNLAYLLASKMGDIEGGYAWAAKAREWAPTDPFAADTLGWIQLQRGEYQWALSLLQESSDHLPQSMEVKYHLACALLATGDEAGCQALLKTILNSGTEFAQAGEAQQMLDVLQIEVRGVTDHDTLIKLRETLTGMPPSASSLYRLGCVLDQLEGPEAALDKFEASRKLNANFLPALAAAASAHLRLGRADKARELVVTARGLNPRDPEVLHTLGVVTYALGQQAWAYSMLKDGLAALPEKPDVQLDFALAAYSLGRMDEAGKAFAEAERLAGAGSDVGRKAAQCRSVLPETLKALGAPEALTRANAILQVWPDCLPALAAKAEAQIADPSLQAEGVALYSDILKRFPAFAPAVKALLGLRASEQDGSDAAQKLAAQGRDLMPDDPEIAESAGCVYYWGKQYATAAGILQGAWKAGQKLKPESLYCLGLSLEETGSKDTARKALVEAVAADPQHALAAKANAILAPPAP